MRITDMITQDEICLRLNLLPTTSVRTCSDQQVTVEKLKVYEKVHCFADSNTALLKNIERKELEMQILHGNPSF